MTLRISGLWGKGEGETSSAAATQSPSEEIHAGSLKARIDTVFTENAAKSQLAEIDYKIFDAVARFLSFINAQDGVSATLRDFSYMEKNKPQLALSVDFAADKLNKKIKEVPIMIELNGAENERTIVTFTHFSTEVGQGQTVGTDWKNSWLEADLATAQGQSDILDYVATRIAAARLKQQYKDRAKGHIYNRCGAHERIAQVRSGKIKPSPFGS